MTVQDSEAETRPCGHCGRPVPQRSSAGRPFRYCRDNDGECQRASRNVRMRHRQSPGLAGQVARTWEVVDRLDQLVGSLTEALHSEMSPAGVERQVAEVRAETSGQVAAAHAERDDARRDTEQATTTAMAAQQIAAAATAERDEARQQAEAAQRTAEEAGKRAQEAATARDEAVRAATAAAALRERAEAERDAAADDLEAARRELQDVRGARDTAERDLRTAIQDAKDFRGTAEAAQRRAEEDLSAACKQVEQLSADAVRERQRATVAERERDAAVEESRRARADAAAAREALSVALGERDASRRTNEDLERSVDRASRDQADLERRLAFARADADAAQDRVAQLTSQVSDLAAALAALGPARPAAPAPTQPAASGSS
jgi:chromosome segregation ATPase